MLEVASVILIFQALYLYYLLNNGFEYDYGFSLLTVALLVFVELVFYKCTL